MTAHSRHFPIHQPDDPGLDECLEPDVGKYPGWLTAIIWVAPSVLLWALAYVVLFEVVLR